MKKAAVFFWLFGWAAFGLPWNSFTPDPQFHRLNVVPFRDYDGRRSDVLLNFAYYVPVGVLGVWFGAPPRLVVAAATALSGTTEVAQLFSVERFPAITDVLVNLSGAAAGMLTAQAIRRLRTMIHRFS
jgi:glycopeptide antibiotics resistance protein